MRALPLPDACADLVLAYTGRNGPLVPAARLRSWLLDAGIEDVTIAPEHGFAIFRGSRVDPARPRSSQG